MVSCLTFIFIQSPQSFEHFEDSESIMCLLPVQNLDSHCVRKMNQMAKPVQRFCSTRICGLRPMSRVCQVIALLLGLWLRPDPVRETQLKQMNRTYPSLSPLPGEQTQVPKLLVERMTERIEPWSMDIFKEYFENEQYLPIILRCLGSFRIFL